MKIIIERALDRYDLAHEYLLQHIKVLTHFGVKGVSTMGPDWKYSPHSHMILAICEKTNKMIGGVRVEIYGDLYELSMESAIRSVGSNISQMIEYLSINGGVAELCGLWVAPSYKKEDIPAKLMNAAIAHAKAISVNNIVGFANEYSKPATEKLGFCHVDNIQDGGIYFYPTEEYKTYVIHKSFTNIKVPSCFADSKRHILESANITS